MGNRSFLLLNDSSCGKLLARKVIGGEAVDAKLMEQLSVCILRRRTAADALVSGRPADLNDRPD